MRVTSVDVHSREQEFANVTLESVSKTFGANSRKSTKALDNVSLSFESGGPALGIVGESGSGKSTMARIIVGLETPSSGTVTFNGAILKELLRMRSSRRDFRRLVQFVGQDTTSSFDPRRTLRDAVRLPAMQLLGLDRVAANDTVDEVLGLLGLPTALANRWPNEVSGGQRQRFALARGLIVRPRLLVCDEVVSALDVSVQGSILNLLKRYCLENGAGLVFVSHGLPATAFVADELVVMYRGKIVDRGPTAAIISGHSTHPYTTLLLNAHRGHLAGAA
jgi:ABC-type oligopeptide transport system ATPase subunit